MWSIVLLYLAAAAAQFSGDAERDFDADRANVVVVDDPGQQDVGLPPGFSALGYLLSGWDMKDLRFRYDADSDALQIAINCYGICGDADGDGDSGGSSDALVQRGGVDLPGFENSEAALVALDLGGLVGGPSDGNMDFIIGYPSQQAVDSDRFPCQASGDTFDVRCFGLYEYSGTGFQAPNNRFRYSTSSAVLPHPTVDNNPVTTADRPDLEWTITDFNGLRRKAGYDPIDPRNEWEFNALAFMGSFQDDGIGEDFFPLGNDFVTVRFPCTAFDACDVCGGDGTSCLDCAGIPNGPNTYDPCDICSGDGSTCLDCAGFPNGPAVYDSCDVCDGDNTSCLDCCGNVFGTCVYDQCDVCDGDNSSCRDCSGTAQGTTTYDICDLCGGDGTTCLDCAGQANGPHVYDECDVCAGDNSSCLDCAGVPNGTAVYDACDVCDGDGLSCTPPPDICNEDFGGCTLNPGQVWRGMFSGNTTYHPELAGQEYRVSIATEDYVMLTVGENTIYGRWAMKGENVLAMQDLVSHPDHLKCDTKPATYEIGFDDTCKTMVVKVINDDCAARRELFGYNQERIKHWRAYGVGYLVTNPEVKAMPMTLHCEPCAELVDNGCKMTTPSIFSGQYTELRENKHEGGDLAEFVVTVAPNGAYVETSGVAAFFGGVSIANNQTNEVLFREFGSQEPQFACESHDWAGYKVRHAHAKFDDPHCAKYMELRLTDQVDVCPDRFQRLEGAPLRKWDTCKLQAERAQELADRRAARQKELASIRAVAHRGEHAVVDAPALARGGAAAHPHARPHQKLALYAHHEHGAETPHHVHTQEGWC